MRILVDATDIQASILASRIGIRPDFDIEVSYSWCDGSEREALQIVLIMGPISQVLELVLVKHLELGYRRRLFRGQPQRVSAG